MMCFVPIETSVLYGGKAERERGKEKNEADQKCALGIDGSGCGALHKVAKA